MKTVDSMIILIPVKSYGRTRSNAHYAKINLREHWTACITAENVVRLAVRNALQLNVYSAVKRLWLTAFVISVRHASRTTSLRLIKKISLKHSLKKFVAIIKPSKAWMISNKWQKNDLRKKSKDCKKNLTESLLSDKLLKMSLNSRTKKWRCKTNSEINFIVIYRTTKLPSKSWRANKVKSWLKSRSLLLNWHNVNMNYKKRKLSTLL